MKETIFISHATPEDNEFTIWLASRLELLGYNVWIDKTELLGGEKFWETIETTIKERASKFLLVYSNNIIDKSSNRLKAGIQKEVDLAKEVVKLNPELKDFLILLHIDNSPFNLFEGAQDLNQIPFNENWAQGLEQLIKKLQKDNVPLLNTKHLPEYSQWYLEHYIVKNPVIEKKELYYTNWWAIKNTPKEFYIFRFANEQQAISIQSSNLNIVLTRNANCITTFESSLNFDVVTETETIKLNPTEIHTIKISDLFNGYEKETFPTRRDAENAYKKLVKRALHVFFRRKGLRWYELANKSLAYFHNTDSLPKAKVRFEYAFRNKVKGKKQAKTKKLYGKYLTVGNWHFAISIKPTFTPVFGFNIKSHLVFTSDGLTLLEDSALIHAYRRKKGKRMFNEEWRDLLLAFMNSLTDGENEISVKVSSTESIIMSPNVETFWSDYGYMDPKDISRQSMFTYEELEEEIDEVTVDEQIL